MSTLRRALGFLFALALATGATLAAAQDDPPGRVGRLADLGGSVSWFDAEEGRWAAAERNRPLTGGDRISTAIDGRAELRVGSTTLRLSNSSELEVLRLDDDRMVFQLHAGSVALRVRSREIADETELVTAEARLLPQRAGHYRFDRVDDSTLAGVWRGELRVADTAYIVGTNQRVELTRENRGRELRQVFSRLPDDGFSSWVLAEDGRDERSAANRFVSPEMTGAEELDRHGRWEQHPDYGAVWYPQAVAVDWAPYRDGRWTWVRPWGWTWVDAAPWGFAPFHYGRWVHWRNRWGWVPGDYAARPVYAPALVAWVGGGAPGFGVSVRIGGGPVGWVPLAPREYYRPYYRHTPVYVDRVNPGPRERWQRPHDDPRGGGRWANQAAPGAVTVVPADVLTRRRPVAPSARSVVLDGRNEPAPNIGAVGPQRPPLQLQSVAPPPGPQAAPVRVDRPGRSERAERAERLERVEPAARVERVERQQPTDRPERGGRDERPVWRTAPQGQAAPEPQVQLPMPVQTTPPMRAAPQPQPQPQAQQQSQPQLQPQRVQPAAQAQPAPLAAPSPSPVAQPRPVPIERAGPPLPQPVAVPRPAQEQRPAREPRERGGDDDRRRGADGPGRDRERPR